MQRLRESCFLAQLPAHNSVHTGRPIALKKGDLMFKQSLLVLVAAGVISIAPQFAGAQDNPSNDQQTAPAQGSGMHHRGMQDPAQRTQELTRKLKLTSDQQTKVMDIFQAAHSQMESLHQDSSLSQEDRRAKMMDIRKGADSQIRAVLDSTQQKKWDEMQARREQHMENHRGGSPDAGSSAPPPQQ
jgi:protein CpxP